MRDRDGRRLAVRVDVLEAPEQRRDVREGRNFGEEAADLDLGIDAAAQPPIALQHHALAEDHERVALLERADA